MPTTNASYKMPIHTYSFIVSWHKGARRRHLDVLADIKSKEPKILAYQRAKEEVLKTFERYSGMDHSHYLSLIRRLITAREKGPDSHPRSWYIAIIKDLIIQMRQYRIRNGSLLNFLDTVESGNHHDVNTKYVPYGSTELSEFPHRVVAGLAGIWNEDKETLFWNMIEYSTENKPRSLWTSSFDSSTGIVLYFEDEQDAMMFKLKFG